MSYRCGTAHLCYFIIFLCLQGGLLEAKLLGVTRQAADNPDDNGVSNTTTNTPDTPTTRNNTVPPEPPSCQPNHHQFEYYSELYNARSVTTNFNGNNLYYALKAMDIHNASNSSTSEEQPDQAIDHSRYSPDIPTKSQVICSKMLAEMDSESRLFSKTALCEWEYICDYKTNRFPHYLFHARCTTDECKGNCNGEHSHSNFCQAHGIHVAVLEKRSDCDDWVWGQEMLKLACTCTNKLLMQ